ncbi:MAG TPA: hypothetical protein VG889_05160 [Rhizomicrobium sp.]|nr:hypothetical protein [Rhizomicrobium sp.]
MRAALGLLAPLAISSAAFADPPDLWLSPQRQVDQEVTWEPLEASRYAILPAGEDAAALKLLARHKIVALDCATFAKVLPGTPCPHDPDRKPYLARSVELLQSVGGINVEQQDGDIDVQYNGPNEPGDLRHRAVILYLAAPPKHLSITILLYG